MGQSGRSTLRGGYQARKARQDDELGQDDVKRQIDSDLNNSKQIYQLVNVKTGGGKLIDIIKSRARHHSLYSSSGSFGDAGIGGVNDEEDYNNEGTRKRKRRGRQDAMAADQKLFQECDQATDEQIRSLVEPLLYNRGRGKLVPLARIWQIRFGGCSGTGGLGEADDKDARMKADEEDEMGQRKSSPSLLSSSSSSSNKNRQARREEQSNNLGDDNFRWVCWRLEERGFVGETALHICFLLSTPTHMILAKKLLNLFPMLINDIYTSDGYFGESSLHMAIVNEDVGILKLLLDHGANVHERCLGSFFLPDDQKDKANGHVKRILLDLSEDLGKKQTTTATATEATNCSGDTSRTTNQQHHQLGIDLQSNHFSDPQTNYEGYTYWGEYPLSFAASLGLADCYKLLLAKGASPNRLDSNGNSTLHICVIANRLDMFDLCYSNGAKLGIVNRLGFSPLTLAAKLRRVEMLFHILTIMRQVNWIFCNVGFVDIPLDEIDSINTNDGSCNDHSVLSIVVSGNSNEHLRMLDGLLSDLLQVKWETSVRGIFRYWLALFIVFLIISSVAYITRLDIKTASKWINEFNATTTTTTKKMASASVDGMSTTTSAGKLAAQEHGGGGGRLVYKVARDYKLANQYSELIVVCCVAYYLFVLAHRCLVESWSSRAPHQNNPKSARSLSHYGTTLDARFRNPRSEANQISTIGARLTGGLMKILVQAPELIIFTFNCLLILLCVTLRLLFNWREAEDFVAAIVMFLMPLKLLFFCRGSKSLGSFIVMIYKILVNDVLCFVVFLIIFIAGFSQSFMLIFKTYRPPTQATTTTNHTTRSATFFESLVRGDESYLLNFYDSFITLHMMALNEFSWVVDEFNSTEYPLLARVLFCVYMILVSILLVNMLIAMLGKTYQDIASQPNENLRQWARALLTVERMCSRKTRLEMLKRYSIEKPRRTRTERRDQDDDEYQDIDIYMGEFEASRPSTAVSHQHTKTSASLLSTGADEAPSSYRCYSSTWALSEGDSAKINAIKQLNNEHLISSRRLARLKKSLKAGRD